MPTTCPHCGTRSPETTDSCTGCGRDLYRLSDPVGVPEPTVGVPALWLSFRPGRPWMWMATGIVLLVVGAGATTGLLLDGGDLDDSPPEERIAQDEVPGPAMSLDPTPSSSPSSDKPSSKPLAEPAPTKTKPPAPPKATPSEKPAPGGIPAGFRRVVDEMGFSLGVMDGWQRRALSATHVDYVPPTGQEVLRIGGTPNAPKASFTSFLETEQQLSGNDPSYQRIRLEHNTFKGQPGAVWEFKWTNEAGEVIHAVDQGYITPDGTEYTIYFEARDRLWDEKNQVFNTALQTWDVRKSGDTSTTAVRGG